MGFFDDLTKTLFGGATTSSQQQAQQQSTQQATQQAQSSGMSQSTSGSAQQANSSQFGASNQTNMNPFTASLGGDLETSLRSLLTGGLPQYGGPLVAGMTGQETGAMDRAVALSGQPSTSMDYIKNVLNGGFLNGNPFLQKMIEAAQRPTLQGLEETLGRVLPGRFTQGGHFTQPQGSSAFDRAAAIATRGAGQTMADIATNLSGQAYNTERGLQDSASKTGVAMDQVAMDNAMKGLQAASLPRMIEDLGIQRGMELFSQRTTQLLELLKTIGGVTAPVLGTTSVSGGQSSSEGSSYGQSSATEQSSSSGQSSGQSTGTSSGTSSGSKNEGIFKPISII